MMAMTEVFEMVLTQASTTLKLENRKVDTNMVEVYVTLILKGEKNSRASPNSYSSSSRGDA